MYSVECDINIKEKKSMWIVFILIVLAIILIPNVKIVPQAHEFVIENLGKYKCEWVVKNG